MTLLAIDVMGGDDAPLVCIEGMAIFYKNFPDARFLIFGDEKIVVPLLRQHKNLEIACEIIHTDELISSTTKPSTALRQFPKSSMRMTLEAVANKVAQGLFLPAIQGLI